MVIRKLRCPECGQTGVPFYGSELFCFCRNPDYFVKMLPVVEPLQVVMRDV